MDREIFKKIGLTNNEIEIYLTLLKSNLISVNNLAKKSGLHRRAIYDTLERLLEKGFVSFSIQNNKKYFQAETPQKVLEYLKDMYQNFQDILPELLALTKVPKEETSVKVFRGKEALRIIFRDKMKILKNTKQENLVWGVDEKLYEQVDEVILKQFIGFLEKNKIKERILVREGTSTFEGGKTSEYRFVQQNSFNPTPIHCYGNKIAFIIFGDPITSIIIENSQLADSYKKQFNLLWRQSKK